MVIIIPWVTCALDYMFVPAPEITVGFLKTGKAKISRVRYPLRAGNGFNEHHIRSLSNIATTLQCRTHGQKREVYCLE
jgi:hypothetical protein